MVLSQNCINMLLNIQNSKCTYIQHIENSNYSLMYLSLDEQKCTLV